MRFLSVFVLSLAFLVPAADELDAQALRDLFNDFDRVRPRGRLLKELFGEQNQGQPNAEQQEQQQPQRQQPTPADPRTRHAQPSAQSPAPSPTTGSHRPSSNQRSALTNNRSANPTPANHTVSFGAKFKAPRSGPGIVVSQVARGGVADNAGLKAGDVITKFGGIEVVESEDFTSVLEILNEGDQIEIEFTRNGKTESEIVSFGEPKYAAEINSAPPQNRAAATDNTSSRSPDAQNAVRNRNTGGRLSSSDYAPIQAPNFDRGQAASNPGGAVSVLSDLHNDSSPTSQINNSLRVNPNLRPQQMAAGQQQTPTVATNTREQQLVGQINQLQQVVRQQQQVIQNLQNQVNNMQRGNRGQNSRGRTNFGSFNNNNNSNNNNR